MVKFMCFLVNLEWRNSFFWASQLMSALFENLSYESQCTSSIWTERSKWRVVMLRFPCLYNTWAHQISQFEVRQKLGRTKARAETLHALTSHALSRTHFHTSLHRAHWRRARVARTWPYKFAQMEPNKMGTSRRWLPDSLAQPPYRIDIFGTVKFLGRIHKWRHAWQGRAGW